MAIKCQHCDHLLPDHVQLATCPFCFKRLSNDASQPDEGVPAFSKTISLEDLEIHFVNNDNQKTIELLDERDLVANLAQPEAVATPFGQDVKPLDGGAFSMPQRGVTGTLVADAWTGDALPADAGLSTAPAVGHGSSSSSDSSASNNDDTLDGDDLPPGVETLHLDEDAVEDGLNSEKNLDQNATLDSQDESAGPPDSTPVSTGDDRSSTLQLESEPVDDIKLSRSEQITRKLSAANAVTGTGVKADVGRKAPSRKDPSRIGTGDVVQRWAKAAGSSRNPLHTVKSETGESRTTDSLHLTVKARTVATAPIPIDADSDYQLVNEIGEGGMGLVYRAKQHSIDRYVAFKTIKKSAAEQSPESRRKFLREAQITGGLDHPNIVPIHDLGISEDGTLFYSMKLVDGTPWDRVMDKKSRDENLEILLKACDAVAFAHSRSVIHRDLKPENVMLGQYGEVLVMDWGLAIDLAKDRSRKPSFGGTPAYMAPEIATHDVPRIGEASDIYLLGAMLYQIITGYPPHPGATVSECVQAAARNEIIPPPDADDELVKIALRAMEAHTTARYAAVADLQAAIRNYRRNAESIALTQRAEESLAAAIQSQDYSKFSKALFGFTDALDIWPDNAAAKIGVEQARLEYGRIACERGDFDLALQYLREDVDAEQPYYRKALIGKREAAEKERRIRRLRTSVLSVISIALLGALGFSGLLAKALQGEKEQTAIAQEARDREVAANSTIRELAESEKLEKERAIDAAEAARKAELAANEAKMKAEGLAQSLKVANENEQAERMKAVRLADSEKEAKKEALSALQEAQLARESERKQNRLNLFKNYPAKLNLAAVQLQRQQDVSRSQALLDEITDLETEMSIPLAAGQPSPLTPLMKNWAYRRVELLGNSDLPSLQLTSNPTCAAASQQANRVAVGTAAGKMVVIQVQPSGLKVLKETVAVPPAPINSIAMAPSGDVVAFSTSSGTFLWDVATDTMSAIASSPPNALKDADWIGYVHPLPYLVVVNGPRLRIWTVDGRGFPTPGQAPTSHPNFVGGLIKNVALVPGRPGLLAALIVPNSSLAGGKSALSFFDPSEKLTSSKSKSVKSVYLSENLPTISDAAVVGENQILIGTGNGNLHPFEFNMEAAREAIALTPLRTDIHTTAIEHFSISPDGQWMVSVGKDTPALQLWQSTYSGSPSDWSYTGPMLGHGNVQVVASQWVGDSNDARLVSVDRGGKCILWDPRALSLRNKIANRDNLAVPIAVGFTSTADARLATVNQDGVIDQWPLSQSHSLQSLATRPWNYLGHAAGAAVWDAALTPDGKTLVTSAKVAGNRYLDFKYKRQMCVWDVEQRALLARWEDELSGDPTLAISDDGLVVLVGSETQALAVMRDPASAKYRSHIIPTLVPQCFAVRPNTSEVAIMGDGGLVNLLSARPPFAPLQSFEEGRTTGKVVKATWCPQGQVLFLVYNNRVEAIRWRPAMTPADRSRIELKAPITLASRDVDTVVTLSPAGQTTLHLTLRSSNSTIVKSYDFDATSSSLSERTGNPDKNERIWLAASGGANAQSPVMLSLAQLNHLGMKSPQALRSSAAGKRFIVVEGTGDFMIVDQGTPQTSARWVRRSNSIAATIAQAPNQSGWNAITTTAQGDIWHVTSTTSADATAPIWRPIDHPYTQVYQNQFSHDGKFLAITGTNPSGSSGTSLINLEKIVPSADQTTELVTAKGVTMLAWNPQNSSEFAGWNPSAEPSKRLAIHTTAGDPPRPVSYPSELDQPNAKLVSINYFRESFANSDDSQWHLVVHAMVRNQNTQSTRIFVIALAENATSQDHPNAVELPNIGDVTVVATSPSENLIAVGTRSGTVSIWLLAPTLDNTESYEIFGIEDHRGSPIVSLVFDKQSNTLVTTDESGRQFAFTSKP